MSKFFYFLNLISLIFFSKQQQQENYIDEFYNKESSKDTFAPDDCLCNTNRQACNYLCCCDEKCNEDTKNHWRERSKCIDEKDTVGIFSDRCIEQNLIVFYNKRRGLKKEEATEDISNSNKMMKNYCFSMDNSKTMSRDIKTVNFVTPNSMYDDDSKTGGEDSTKKDYFKININNISEEFFSSNGYFSLYSGADCGHPKEVEKFTNVNFTCSIGDNNEINSNKDLKNAINNNNIYIGDNQCKLNSVYKINKGLLEHTHLEEGEKSIETEGENNEFIVEMEFIIKMNDYNDNNLECYINVVKSDKNLKIFKNSVIFIQGSTDTNTSKIPYKYSGTNGYYNDYPLKISIYNNDINKYILFNEYYIVGKETGGGCRFDENIYNYLYNDDKPILFNQNVVYFCSLTDNDRDISNTTLFRKIDAINKIAKYGDSNFKQITDNNYWVEIDKSKLDPTIRNNTNIQMNIYLGTKKIGVHSFKYIYKVILKNIEGERTRLTLDIKYIDLDKTSEHEEKPNYPTFIPSLPADLLDPIIYSQVDK